MLKAGLVGAGHLGKIHLRLLNQSDKYELVGFHDKDVENGKKLEAEFGYKYFENFDDLFSTSLPWEWNSLFWLVSGRGISLPGDHKYNPKKAYKEENDKAC